jgi:lauroyl/myristoyl acyltransferase
MTIKEKNKMMRTQINKKLPKIYPPLPYEAREAIVDIFKRYGNYNYDTIQQAIRKAEEYINESEMQELFEYFQEIQKEQQPVGKVKS